MPLTGVIQFSGGVTFPLPTGAFSMIGVDGNHYAIGVTPPVANVGCAETNSVIYTLTEADWRTHLAAFSLGTSGSYEMTATVPAKGTPYFLQLGYRVEEPDSHFVGVWYRINSDSSVEPIFGIFLVGADNAVPTAGCWGSDVIGDYLYAVIETGFPAPVSSLATYLTKLPLPTGNLVNTAPGAANLYQTVIGAIGATHHYSWDSFRTFEDGERIEYTDKVSIIEDPDGGGIGLLRYIGNPGTTAVFYEVVDPDAHTVGSPVDLSTSFNVPFADVGLDHDGGASASAVADYTSPSIGPNGEVIFWRSFVDEPQIARGERFTFNGVADIVYEGRIEFHHNDEAFDSDVTMVQSYRQDGELLVMFRDNSRFIFGYVEISDADGDADCASSGFDLRYPPCVTRWTQCVRIVRRDGLTFRFTTLDRDFEFRGEAYLSCNSLNASATQTMAGLGEVGSSELQGILAVTDLDEADLYGGLFDDAFCEIWRAPYEGEDIARRLGAGWVGKISQGQRGYRMEVLGPGSRLEQRPIVQVYTPSCRRIFGSAQNELPPGGCGIDIEALAIAGTVTSGLNRGVFTATLGPEPIGSGTGEVASSGDVPGRFVDGRVRWLTGVNAGQTTEVKSVDFDTGLVTLWALTAHIPETGDTFELLPGCDLTAATCKNVYDNFINFGGFPDIPGQDSLMEAPDAKLAS